MRGAFYLNLLRTPFAPSARAAGVSRGQHRSPPFVILSAAKNLASHPLKLCSLRLRACQILLTPGRSFSPAASYFFPTAERSNQETPPRCLRRSIADAIDRCPALLGRGGVHRQAIPGLTMDASASLPRPRLRAAIPPRPARLGAARRGGTSEAESKANQKHLVIPAKAGIQDPKPRTPLPAPHPNPLPRSGERGLNAGGSDAFDLALAVLWTFPPFGSAEHRSPRRHGPARLFARGEAGMPKLSPTGHGWPVGETRRGREAQGTLSSRFFFCDERARTSGKKVTRHPGGTALSIHALTARAQARTARLQSAIQNHPCLRQSVQPANTQ